MFYTSMKRMLQHPWAVLLAVLCTTAVGANFLQGLRRDVFPDLSAPLFHIIVQNAAMGAEELESSVALPLERSLSGLAGAKRVRSSMQQGVAQISIEFSADTDAMKARQMLAERLAAVAPSFPPNSEPPLLSSLTGRLNEIMEITLQAEEGTVDLMTLRDLAEFEVQQQILAVSGVASVERLGGYLRQFQVKIDEERAALRGISLEAILHALDGASAQSAGGLLVRGDVEWNIRILAKAEGTQDLGNVVVSTEQSTKTGVPVLLRDVADIREAPATRRGLAHRLDGEIVSCRVVKQFGADTVEVAAKVREAVAALQTQMPKGVTIQIDYDQSILVDESLSGVGRAVLLGAVLVAIVLLLLLGNWRAGLIVATTIPLSLAIAGYFLHVAGVGLNVMTLGGLAIAVGILVDAAIIVVENILHEQEMHQQQNQKDPKISVDQMAAAVLRVGSPILFATLIIAAVFVPLYQLGGIEGKMYQPLAAAVLAAIFASLLIAMTWVPALGQLFLRGFSAKDSTQESHTEKKQHDTALIHAIKKIYQPALSWSMRHAGLVRAASLLVTVPAIWLALHIGADFMPELDEGAILLQTQVPAEASLETVDQMNHWIEDRLREIPEIDDVVRRTGRSEQTEDPMPHTISDVLIVLKPERQRSIDAINDDIREKLEDVAGISAMITTPLGMRIDEGLGGTPADVAIRVFGNDLSVLATLTEEAKRVAEQIDGLAEIQNEQAAVTPQIHIVLNRTALSQVGLTPGEVLQAIQIATVGQHVGEIWRGMRRFSVVLRGTATENKNLESLKRMQLTRHDGVRFSLEQVADIFSTLGPASIRREAGERRMAVEASVVERDLVGTVQDLRQQLSSEINVPQGYRIEVGGRIESQERAKRALQLAALLSGVVVLALLWLALGGMPEALVVLAALPDACVGGIVALWLSGETWNISSLVGLIGLCGIAVQNGLVLVTQTKALLAEGITFDEALQRACVSRVRPKLLTASTAILGLLPILILPLRGVELEHPLAVVMIGGLFTSTIFTLLALPTFYALVYRWTHRARSTDLAVPSHDVSP